MVQLYFKHLYISMQEWQEEPFAPWKFKENVLLSVLSFFESKNLVDNFSLKEELDCKIFVDSGAFAATAMDYQLDPYEVAEMQAILKADLIVPLDLIVVEQDSEDVAKRKVLETIKNTEILLDLKPKGSEIVAPLQGLTEDILEFSYNKFKEMGLNKFALGGIVFQPQLEENLKRIKITQDITGNDSLHVFGKFLHPELLHYIIDLKVDSVDGYGYIVSSLKGLYIYNGKYLPVAKLEEEVIDSCNCNICKEFTLADFIKGSKESQLLLVQHNIYALNSIAEQLQHDFDSKRR